MKLSKSNILAFILGTLFSSSIVYAATLVASSNVSYTSNSQSTVEGALNDLYTKSKFGDATASDIKSGKKALVNGSQVTGTLTVPSYTSISGTTTIQPGNSSTNLNGYYNASNYKVSCDSCPTCDACNIDTSEISSTSSTSSSWTKTVSVTSSMKKVIAWVETVSDNQAKAPTVTSCPSGMTCTLVSTVSEGGVSGAFSRSVRLLIIDNPSGLNGDVSIKMTYVKTTGAKHYFVILSQ